jgi:hypothetical protein
MPSTRLAALTAALACALSAAPVLAGDGSHKIPEACQADAASLCPGMAPGDGKFGKCMKEHRDKVSEGCRTAVKQARAGHEGKHGAGKGASGSTASGMSEGGDDE